MTVIEGKVYDNGHGLTWSWSEDRHMQSLQFGFYIPSPCLAGNRSGTNPHEHSNGTWEFDPAILEVEVQRLAESLSGVEDPRQLFAVLADVV